MFSAVIDRTLDRDFLMLRITVFVSLFLAGSVTADECPTRLLVSGHGSDNVHVFDACSGRFTRLLDSAGRIDGAQGIAEDDQERLYLASEENGRILRYRADNLAFIDVFVGPGGLAPLRVKRPTGVAVGPDGDVYVAGFNSDDIVRLDPDTGRELRHYPLHTAGLSGPDAGIAFLPDGRLLVPGFESDNLIALDPETGETQRPLESIQPGLSRPRTIRVDPIANRILISSWGSNRVIAFEMDEKIASEVLRTPRPTGFLQGPDGGWLVTSDADSTLHEFDAVGRRIGEWSHDNTGGLSGATFIHRLEVSTTLPQTVNSTDSRSEARRK